jgi:hypothetical protein
VGSVSVSKWTVYEFLSGQYGNIGVDSVEASELAV